MDLMKLKGNLGALTIEEMDAMDESELKNTIVQANTAMEEVKEELDGNEKYQTAKQAVKDLSAGKREVDKRQKGKIQYALSRLEELGKMGNIERLDWEKVSLAAKARAAARAASNAESGESEQENE